MNFSSLDNLQPGKTLRASSWDKSGGNADFRKIPPHSTATIADIEGPGRITHIWMTSWGNYRNILIKITWDDAPHPSILVPWGDFFGQGNCIVNSFQCAFFTSSTDSNNKMGELSALNCYLPMPFKKHAKIELINESDREQLQYFYIDYEKYENEEPLGTNPAYLHAEFRRQNPFGGWGPELKPNSPEVDSLKNVEKNAWENNYVLMETEGKGHYIGCFFNVVNLQAKEFGHYEAPKYSWWGEGDDMIWVDGYKWPPDLHGTGSEDYFNQALGMQRNAFWRNGTVIHEFDTLGYSTSYVFHIENPVRFQEKIKVTIEIGHANHLGNDISSVAFWYAAQPTQILSPPPVEQRQPIKRKDGQWIIDPKTTITAGKIPISKEMGIQKREWKRKQLSKPYKKIIGTFEEDDKGHLSMNIQVSPGNFLPISFYEVMEDLVEDNHLREGAYLCKFVIFDEIIHILIDEELEHSLHDLEEKLKPYVNLRLKITSGIILEEEKDLEQVAEKCVIFTDNISFRD